MLLYHNNNNKKKEALSLLNPQQQESRRRMETAQVILQLAGHQELLKAELVQISNDIKHLSELSMRYPDQKILFTAPQVDLRRIKKEKESEEKEIRLHLQCYDLHRPTGEKILARVVKAEKLRSLSALSSLSSPSPSPLLQPAGIQKSRYENPSVSRLDRDAAQSQEQQLLLKEDAKRRNDRPPARRGHGDPSPPPLRYGTATSSSAVPLALSSISTATTTPDDLRIPRRGEGRPQHHLFSGQTVTVVHEQQRPAGGTYDHRTHSRDGVNITVGSSSCDSISHAATRGVDPSSTATAGGTSDGENGNQRLGHNRGRGFTADDSEYDDVMHRAAWHDPRNGSSARPLLYRHYSAQQHTLNDVSVGSSSFVTDGRIGAMSSVDNSSLQ